MKRIFLAIALFASLSLANAQTQVKSVDASRKAVESALSKTENPKQAEKPATWIKLGKAYLDAYSAPMGAGWIGAPRQDLALILGEDRPSSEEWVEVSGTQMIKAVFPTRNYYYNENEILQMIEVTEPVYPDALELSLEAYKQAASLDEKQSKKKDLVTAFQTLDNNFTTEAYTAYTLGDLTKASYYFEKAYEASVQQPYAQIDTNAIYNAALTSYMLEDLGKAKGYYNECLALGYYGDGGDVYAKLADIAVKEGKNEEGQQLLEEGFAKFPQSQAVLVGLINIYLSSGQNTDRLFELIDAAKANEPDNASLWYVEGNIHLQLGNEEAAIAAYKVCSEKNPAYEFGYIGIGQLYYNKAVTIQEEAVNEMDDKKYEALVNQFEEALKACIEPFENAFAISQDPQIKVAVAEYLKNACYRFSSEPGYQAKYEKYDAIVKGL